MVDSDVARLSVSLVEVLEGREGEFREIAKEIEALMSRSGWGHSEVVPDEGSPRRFYAVRRWANAEAAEACQADAAMRSLTSKLFRIAHVTQLVNGARKPESLRLLIDDGSVVPERDRRTGFDRRVLDVGRVDGDRRANLRRVGPRPVVERFGPLDLVTAARRAREHAVARFSNFKVGAAIETATGTVVSGCNIENATYGLTVCAERIAIFKALSDGHRSFTRLAVVADTAVPTPPCGACRQILWEFGGDLEVILGNLTDEKGRFRLRDLLPHPFDARLLTP